MRTLRTVPFPLLIVWALSTAPSFLPGWALLDYVGFLFVCFLHFAFASYGVVFVSHLCGLVFSS